MRQEFHSLDLHCDACYAVDRFTGRTAIQAEGEARGDGWTVGSWGNADLCPECSQDDQAVTRTPRCKGSRHANVHRWEVPLGGVIQCLDCNAEFRSDYLVTAVLPQTVAPTIEGDQP